MSAATTPDLSVDLAPNNPRELRLRNPVIAASGCFGYGEEYASVIDINRLGAFVSKGITPERRAGNPMPRIVESPAGMLNAIGLQNPGIRGFVKKYPPIWARWTVPAIVNISAESVERLRHDGRHSGRTASNRRDRGQRFLPEHRPRRVLLRLGPNMSAEVTRAVRSVTTLPLIVKLSPGAPDIASVAVAVEEAGADAISLINTLVGMAIDVRRRKPAPGKPHRRSLGPGNQADCRADGLSGCSRCSRAGDRYGRDHGSKRRPRVLSRRSDGDSGWNWDLCRSRATDSPDRRSGALVGRRGILVSRANRGHCQRRLSVGRELSACRLGVDGSMRLGLPALALVAVALVLEYAHIGGPTAVFLASALSLIPLAGLLGRATEEAAIYTGPRIGALLNATLGNAAELIITIIALRAGLVELVKASIAGSIIGNILVVLGLSLLVGGIRNGTQFFDAKTAGTNATMMALAVVSLSIPAVFALGPRETRPSGQTIAFLSDGLAIVLIVIYALYIFFSLRQGEP